MKTLSRPAKKALIAACAALSLAVLTAVLLLTAPKKPDESAPPEAANIALINKPANSVLSLEIENENGAYTFSRSQYGDAAFWTSDALEGVGQSDSAVRNLIECLSSLEGKPLEENAPDLAKYGLSQPKASVRFKFDDGEAELFVGDENPLDKTERYIRFGGDVFLVKEYAVSGLFLDIKSFANLLMTKNLGADEAVEYVIIERKDLEAPVEIRYMQEFAAARKEGKLKIPTLNTHRFSTPFTAEIDVIKGSHLYNGVCALTMNACAYLEKSAENLEKCGLSDPFCAVRFSYGGIERKLFLGNEIKEPVGTSAPDAQQIFRTTGIYAALEGVPGIFVIAPENAPWYSFTPADFVTRKPLSPHIFAVSEISLEFPDESFEYKINGSEGKYFLGETELDKTQFEKFFELLTGSSGEELYLKAPQGEAYAAIKFAYTADYAALYGSDENTLAFYPDGEKYIITLDEKPLYRVRKAYVERLLDCAKKLAAGEKINIVW